MVDYQDRIYAEFEHIQKAIADFAKALKAENITVEKMILFGSYATGHARPDSDIDRVVVSDDFEGKDYWQRIDILSSAVYAASQ